MLTNEGFVEALARETPALVETEDRVGEVELGRRLGKGAFSVVYAGSWRRDARRCALKRISKRDVKTLREVRNLAAEHAALKALSGGPGVLELQAVFASQRYLYFALEQYGAELYAYVKTRPGIPRPGNFGAPLSRSDPRRFWTVAHLCAISRRLADPARRFFPLSTTLSVSRTF